MPRTDPAQRVAAMQQILIEQRNHATATNAKPQTAYKNRAYGSA